MDFVIGKLYLKVDFSKSELAKSYLKSISIIAYHKSFANAFHIYLKKTGVHTRTQICIWVKLEEQKHGFIYIFP